MTPRAAMLDAVRRGLGRGALSADQAAVLDARMARPPRHPTPARAMMQHAELVTQFIHYATREYATVARVASLADVPASLADWLASQNLPPRLARAPHPELDAIPWEARPLLEVEARRAEATDLVALTHGFAGIAETGTLMLPSGPERPTTLNLLPDTAIVLLRESRIVGPLEDAWDLLRAHGPMPRNVMLVTGPSRSADIEQTLELGAHGPRRLHILLLADAPA